MNSIMFGGKIVMVMHIVTIEPDTTANQFLVSLSNGLVLAEKWETEEERNAIAKKLAFINVGGADESNGS